jgi:hypothetical protein
MGFMPSRQYMPSASGVQNPPAQELRLDERQLAGDLNLRQ